jgi:hypothetical protein
MVLFVKREDAASRIPNTVFHAHIFIFTSSIFFWKEREEKPKRIFSLMKMQLDAITGSLVAGHCSVAHQVVDCFMMFRKKKTSQNQKVSYTNIALFCLAWTLHQLRLVGITEGNE